MKFQESNTGICLILILGLGMVGSACRETNSSADLKIFGGKATADEAWISTVALLTYGSVDCTGVVIHPRLVLTAAHCVSSGVLDVYIGQGLDNTPLDGITTIERVVSSPLFGPSPQGYNDIAYILMKDPLAISQDALQPILNRPDEIEEVMRVGQKARIVGFGQREDQSIGSKYEADTTITALNAAELAMGGGGIDACAGDSGGPAYVQLKSGEWRVFAVASRGRACGRGGVWSRLDPHLCWIQKSSGIDLNLQPDTCANVNVPDDPSGQ